MRNIDTETVITSIAGNVPKPQAVYLGDDGMLHCAECNDPVETRRFLLGEERTLPIICSCKRKAIDAEKRKREAELLDAKRRACFGGDRVAMMSCTFDTDERYDKDASNISRMYAASFKTYYEDGKGLLFFGPVGTGKTFYAAAICNHVIDKGYTALFTSFNSISNQLLSDINHKADVMAELRKPSLLVLDDLGAERTTEYMQEVVFSVIDERLATAKPLVVTGNITPEQLYHPKTWHQQRIYDRLMGACLPVEVKGQSIRKLSAMDWHKEEMQKLMGGIYDD